MLAIEELQNLQVNTLEEQYNLQLKTLEEQQTLQLKTLEEQYNLQLKTLDLRAVRKSKEKYKTFFIFLSLSNMKFRGLMVRRPAFQTEIWETIPLSGSLTFFLVFLYSKKT